MLNEIAHGGMGIVYRARQLSLDRLVAIKMIRVGDSATDLERQRFHVEASSAARLDHQNIVAIYEIGEHQGQPYFSMQLIDGGTLANAIEQSTLPVNSKGDMQNVAKLMCSICQAVQYAHEYGVLHRDLKPSNILLDNHGTPFVADFGLAKHLFDDAGVTATGAIIGTPAFMSPEQASGKSMLTVRSDVYALGAILYAILGRRSPFNSPSPMDAIRDVLNSKPTRITELNPNVDRDLAIICHKCLEKEPDQRYASAAALANDLTRWRESKTIAARPASLVETTWYWIRRNPQFAGIGALLAIFLLCNVAFITMGFAKSAANLKALRVSQYANVLSEIRMAIDARDYSSAVQLLASHPAPETGDKSNAWEWNYLARQIPVEYQLSGYHEGKFSPDGKQFAALNLNDRSASNAGMYYGLDVWTWSKNFNELDEEVSQSFSEIHRARLNATLTIVKKTDVNKRIPQQIRWSLVWSPDGRFLAYRNQAQSIVDIYDRDKQSVNRIELTNQKLRRSFSQVAWSTDATKLLITDDDRIDVYSASGSTLLHSFAFDFFLGNVSSTAWTADNRIAVTVDTKTHFFSVDGQLLDTWEIAVGSWNRTGTHWVTSGTVGALGSPTPMHHFELDEKNVGPFWVGDASKLAIMRGNEIEFLDLEGFKSTGKHIFVGEPRLSTFKINCLYDSGPSGMLISQSIAPGQMYLCRFPQKDATTKADLTREVTALAAEPNGQSAAVAFRPDLSGDAAVGVLDKHCHLKQILQSGTSTIAALSWDPSGERVAALDQKGMLRIWDVKTGDVQLTFQLNDPVSKDTVIDLGGPAWQLWWSPSGEYIASSCSYTKQNTRLMEYTVSILKLEPLRLEQVQPFHRGLGWLPTSEFVMERAANSFGSQGFHFSVIQHQREYSERRPTIEIFNLHDGSVHPLTELPLPPVKYPAPILSKNEVVYLGSGEAYRKQTIAQRISLEGGHGETPIYSDALDVLRFLTNQGANRIFTLDRTNHLRVVDESEFQTLHSIAVQNANSASIDYRDGILWLADGQSVYRFNGTPIELGSTAAPVERPIRGWKWLMGLISSLLLISGLSFLPWWLSSKEASQVLSRVQRWLIILGAIASGVLGTWIFSSEALNLFRPDLNYGDNWFRVFELVSLIAMSVGLTNYIRLAILRRWPLELLLLLLHVMPFLILTAYRCWPELNENWGERFPAPVVLILGILFPFFAVGFEHTWIKAKKNKITIRKRDRKSNLIYSLPNALFSSLVLLLLAVAIWIPILNYRFLVVQPDWPVFVRTRMVATMFFIGCSLFNLLYLWSVFTRNQDDFKSSRSRENASHSDGSSNAA